MSDIFISYKREDLAIAELLAGELEHQGFSVWWDPRILPGERFAKAIKRELGKAKCIIVLWSKWSVESDWVLDEAEIGKQRGILVPAWIDNVEIPLGFRGILTASLVDWNGRSPHTGFDQLLEAVRSTLHEAESKPSLKETSDEQKEGKHVETGWRFTAFIAKHKLFVLSIVGIAILAAVAYHFKMRNQYPLLFTGDPNIAENTDDPNNYDISFEFTKQGSTSLKIIAFQVLSDPDFEGRILDLRASIGTTPKKLVDVEECESKETKGDRKRVLAYNSNEANIHTLTVTVSSLDVLLKISASKKDNHRLKPLIQPVIWPRKAWYKSLLLFFLIPAFLTVLAFGVKYWASWAKKHNPGQKK